MYDNSAPRFRSVNSARSPNCSGGPSIGAAECRYSESGTNAFQPAGGLVSCIILPLIDAGHSTGPAAARLAVIEMALASNNCGAAVVIRLLRKWVGMMGLFDDVVGIGIIARSDELAVLEPTFGTDEPRRDQSVLLALPLVHDVDAIDALPDEDRCVIAAAVVWISTVHKSRDRCSFLQLGVVCNGIALPP